MWYRFPAADVVIVATINLLLVFYLKELQLMQ